MKKSLKLGIVALSLMTVAATVYTANVKAANQVRVEITGGTNSCDAIADYDWGEKPASLSVTPLEETGHDLVCRLLASDAGNVTIELTDLTGANGTIENSNFDVTLDTGHVDGSLDARGWVDPETFDSIKTFYPKQQYHVGNLSGTIILSGHINAGQAIGTYEGELNVGVPNS